MANLDDFKAAPCQNDAPEPDNDTEDGYSLFGLVVWLILYIAPAIWLGGYISAAIKGTSL